ncbi:gluconokinase [Rhodoferax sp.]|uniref:gluconokinase n=1 Tax=Rhodoferax sp. TaxID=50421 RepID=UPI0025D46CF9|nr:gluconokinase [Rhodoferax sp.]MCM2295962.1 gluconokinase [Rhodoferax sp.]MDD3936648.1 gluconokinase [Rhodoferax sp.]
MNNSIVIMGVAGCGKSSLGAALARTLGIPLIEGDNFHSAASRSKMSQGIALTDADRDGWLDTLCEQLRAYPEGVVMTCSALKKVYRDRLRHAAPALRFAFLDISRNDAQVRVQARAKEHFFATTLVDSQFATLQDPTGEPGVLALDATEPLQHLTDQVATWMTKELT